MKNLPDINSLDDEVVRAIAQFGGVRKYAAQAVLVTEGDQSDALYIIITGRVKAYGAEAQANTLVN